MLCMITTFDPRFAGATRMDVERHYLERHVLLARRLPGLRAYVVGTLAATPASRPTAGGVRFSPSRVRTPGVPPTARQSAASCATTRSG
jgi:hypothetical protein